MSGSNKAKFAEAAIAIFNRAMRGEHLHNGDTEDREVRQVGYGLALLRQLTTQFAKKLERRSATQRASSGFREAEGLLDALVTGSNHLIFRHVASLRSGRFRPQKAGANISMRRRRACVAGFILAYQKAANVKESEAARIVVKACHSKEFSLGKDTSIVKWILRSSREDVRFYRDRILRRAEEMDHSMIKIPRNLEVPLAERVRLAGKDLVWELWSVPV
jgi:hypothetical protein